MIIIETDVLIDFLSDHQPGAKWVEDALQRGSAATTAITRFELLSGARTTRQQSTIVKLLDTIPTLSLDQEKADRAAEVRRTLEAKGITIGMGDSLIAGIAIHHNGRLLTRNRRHFERVPDLLLATGT